MASTRGIEWLDQLQYLLAGSHRQLVMEHQFEEFLVPKDVPISLPKPG